VTGVQTCALPILLICHVLRYTPLYVKVKEIADSGMLGELVSLNATEEDMHRVVGNLLENAVKYTPSGGTVSVALRAEDSQVTLVVSDSGIGIAPEALPHIFEEFYRAANVKAMGTEGTGLGLSLVKRIVDLYQGEVRVESELEKGTTFTVTLPRDPGMVLEGPASGQKP
jgi:two-component system phosphate regulon sensor histidine kinase PhoR